MNRATRKTQLNEHACSVTNYLVKQRPASRLLTAAISLVVASAWLLAANHCAVGALRPVAKSAHLHCPGHAAPEQQKKSSDGGCDDQTCCKSLSVPAVGIAKSPVEYDDASFVAKEYPDAALTLSGGQHTLSILELDTGPPHAGSFAESVLQRSLLAHAPPLVA